MADADLTARARAVLARVNATGGAFVWGRDVASARSLVRRGLVTLEDNGATRTGTECDRERWWCKATDAGRIANRGEPTAADVLASLTKPQRRAVNVMRGGPVSWSPGDVPNRGNQQVRMVTLRRLKAMGVVHSYSIHPYGPFPVYGCALTDDLGREVARLLAEQIEVARAADSLVSLAEGTMK